MKILILMLVSLAVVACGVPQEEHDEVSNRLSQTETKLDAVSTELKTVSSELEANNKLVDGLKERIAFIPQKPPTFATGEASALVQRKIMDDITWLQIDTQWGNRPWFIFGQHDQERPDNFMCIPLVFLIEHSLAKGFSSGTQNSPREYLNRYLLAKGLDRSEVSEKLALKESYSEEGFWLVTLEWGELLNSDTDFDGDSYQWKVYELSGAVERIGVDRTYC